MPAAKQRLSSESLKDEWGSPSCRERSEPTAGTYDKWHRCYNVLTMKLLLVSSWCPSAGAEAASSYVRWHGVLRFRESASVSFRLKPEVELQTRRWTQWLTTRGTWAGSSQLCCDGSCGLADLERGSGEVTTLKCECCFHGDEVVFIHRMTGVDLPQLFFTSPQMWAFLKFKFSDKTVFRRALCDYWEK